MKRAGKPQTKTQKRRKGVGGESRRIEEWRAHCTAQFIPTSLLPCLLLLLKNPNPNL